MKRRIALLGLALLLGFLTVSGQARGRFSWTYSTAGEDQIAGNADDDPFCVSSADVGCVTGFILQFRDKQGVERTGIAFVPAGVCALAPGSVHEYRCSADVASATGVGRYDNNVWYVRVLSKDSTGAAKAPSPESNTVEVERFPRPAKDLAVS